MSAGRRAQLAGLAIVAVTAFACAGERGDLSDGQLLPSNRSDGLTVMFASAPDPLERGDNAIQVTVRGSDGSPVTDAAVTAVFSMPAMPSMNMPAMRSEAPLTPAGAGRYRGTSRLSMGGTWNIEISIVRSGNPAAERRLSLVARD